MKRNEKIEEEEEEGEEDGGRERKLAGKGGGLFFFFFALEFARKGFAFGLNIGLNNPIHNFRIGSTICLIGFLNNWANFGL